MMHSYVCFVTKMRLISDIIDFDRKRWVIHMVYRWTRFLCVSVLKCRSHKNVSHATEWTFRKNDSWWVCWECMRRWCLQIYTKCDFSSYASIVQCVCVCLFIYDFDLTMPIHAHPKGEYFTCNWLMEYLHW